MLVKLKNYFTQLNFSTAIKLTLINFLRKYINPYVQNSYSEVGEDMIIENIIKKEKGFYLEIGSNHPIHLSNTFKLYCNGWKGICIDGNSGLVKLHKKIRPKDIVLNYIVSDVEKDVKFYKFKFNPVSTIDESILEDWKKLFGEIEAIEIIKSIRLDSILNDLKDKGLLHQDIDFMSIDVEGHDLQVLKSIDLEKFRPKLIVIEMHGFNLNKAFENEIYSYLLQFNYKMISFLGNNGFFRYN